MHNMNIINNCEVCDNNNLIDVLSLGDHPMCDDLQPIDSKTTCQFYPIHILFCDICKTAHQKYQISKQSLFPTSYHYRARFTKDVLNGMESLVNDCIAMFGNLKGKKVLDVGANDGSLLNIFKKHDAICIGIEPTNAALDASEQLDMHNKFFDKNIAQEIYAKYGSMDIITFTNVFAHIENLPDLLDALKILINKDTKLIIENHYLGTVLKTKQFDTFYHEHPRTYSATSFKYIAAKLDMSMEKIVLPKRYGGNIRVTLSCNNILNNPELEQIVSAENDYINLFKQMNLFISKWRDEKRSELIRLKNLHNNLYAKAFPGRAAILIKLLNIDIDLVQGVFEQDSSIKVGHFVPGTSIPILPDSQIKIINPPVLINLAWHIKTEIEEYLRENSYTGEIVHIV